MERFTLRRLGLLQAARLALCVLRIGLARLRGGVEDLFQRGDPAERRRSRELREASLLADTLGALKGPFAKLGQFASLRYDVLSPAVRERLAVLQERVPPLPFARVRGLIEAELGAPIGARFPRLDPEPLGAASIAQVHRGWLPDGRPVAVKVQYPWLAASLPADLAVSRALLALILRGRARSERRRVFDEFAAGVRGELDFVREAEVAGEIARNLADDERIVVPRVIRSHTTRRVLTMAYHPTVRITDGAGLARLGVDPREVLEILARAYAKQVFVDGLFHADPHPGNVFVIDEPGAASRPRVLFVDFGLSRRLAPELRSELRRGMYALLGSDLEAFLTGMERMQMIAPGAHEGVRRAVASMFARIRDQESRPLSMSGRSVLALKDEAKRLLEETEGLQLPNDLLLYAKTLSYLFALGEEIAPEVDLMRISLPYLLRFLAEGEPA